LVEGGIILRLQAKQGVPKFEEIKEGSVRKVPNPEIAESIGNLSNLPEGAKIVEVVPLEVKEAPKCGFNVQPNTYQKSSVDAALLKQTFNKQAIDTLAFSTVDKFPASYMADGNIYFGPGKAMLTVAVETHLEQLAKSIVQKNSQVKILAYADAKQEAKVGEYIAKLRAEEVTKFLISRGVDFKQLDVVITAISNLKTNVLKARNAQNLNIKKTEELKFRLLSLSNLIGFGCSI
jgi:outer membrane protein OmpA-like peptidoglycan-associated protein